MARFWGLVMLNTSRTRQSPADEHPVDHNGITAILNYHVHSHRFGTLQAAADIAASQNKTLVIEGANTLTQTLTLNCAVICTPDASLTSSASPAVIIGDDNAVLTMRDIDLPPLQPQTPIFDYRVPVIGSDVGVLMKAMRNCRVRLRQVKNFSTGVHIASSPGHEFSYNTLYDWALNHNGVGLRIYPADNAWCNENAMRGGQINALGGFTRVAGMRFIEMDINPIGGYGPNGWLFDHVSLEGNTPEYHIYLDGATSNTWSTCRWEGTPYVYLTAPIGKYCLENLWAYGYNPSAITLEVDPLAQGQLRDNVILIVSAP